MDYIVIKVDKNGNWFKHKETLNLDSLKIEWDPPADKDFMDSIKDKKNE